MTLLTPTRRRLPVKAAPRRSSDATFAGEYDLIIIDCPAREAIELDLGEGAPIFRTSIRHAEAAAQESRERGLLAFELEKPCAPPRSGGSSAATRRATTDRARAAR